MFSPAGVAMPGGGGPPGEAGAGRRWTALVADASLEFRARLATTIQNFDPTIRVLGAATGVEARNLLLRRRPQLAFVNLQLPKMTGAEALAWAVARRVRPFSVVISGLVLPRWIELSLELNAYEFLRNPFDPAHVTHMLEAYRRMASPIRLLLADGSPTARALVRRVLAESRFSAEIDEAASGDEALKLLASGAYETALVDRHLPGLDGLELACQAGQVAPQTRFMLMASGDGPGADEAVRQFGIVALLRKPFYVWDVDLAFHTAFGLRRPYLLNALPAYHESEARKARERIAETAAVYARRAEPVPEQASAAPEPTKERTEVVYI
jgi:CheY-like chemotaxis protein